MMKMTKKPLRPPLSWAARLNKMMDQLVRRDKADLPYATANCKSIVQVVDGMGPDSSSVDPRAGARMVLNLSSAHVPAFCEESKKYLKEKLMKPLTKPFTKPYKNGYDMEALGKHTRSKSPISATRATVDAALPLPPGAAKNTYFGALELSGTGIRFYGDICLVLKREQVLPETVLLDRNSYDLVRAPTKDRIAGLFFAEQDAARKSTLRTWSGEWGRDVGAMAAIKVVKSLGLSDRRWTTGKISEAVREDEDYIEVLRIGSFAADDLQEARMSATDAAHDALIGSRLSKRPLPRLESMIWRNRRSHAELALRSVGVAVRIVTSSGRMRG